MRGAAHREQRVCVRSGGVCWSEERRVRGAAGRAGEESARGTERVEGERRGHQGSKSFGAYAMAGVEGERSFLCALEH